MKTETTEVGHAKGEVCNRNGCDGIIDEHEKEGSCSCHINPPCGYCTEDSSFCPKCDYSSKEDQAESNNAPYSEKSFQYYKKMAEEGEARNVKLQLQMNGKLPIEKFDYNIISHTHFSQICRGVCPEGMTMADVLKVVRGSFGGRFTRFENGAFEYIAYTD